MSGGEWDLFPARRPAFYDAQGEALLAGRLDVPCESVRAEALKVGDRCYGYFGPTPALLRIVANALFPAYFARWTRFSILSAAVLTLALVVLLLRQGERESPVPPPPWEAGFVGTLVLLNVGLASTLLPVTSRGLIYQEAIVWANFFVLACAMSWTAYLRSGSWKACAAACVASVLALHTRVSVGYGTTAMLLLGLGYLLTCDGTPGSALWRHFPTLTGQDQVARRARWRVHAVLFVAVLAAAASPHALAYRKYREWNLIPLDRHVFAASQPDRFARTQGSFVHLANLPFNFGHYFRLELISSPWFPYLRLGPRDWGWRDWNSARFYRGEPLVGIPAAMPLLLAASLFGAWGRVRSSHRVGGAAIPALVGTLLGGATILVVTALTPRYRHDFFPFLVLGATAALPLLWRLRRAARIGVYVVAVLGTAYGVWVSTSSAFLEAFPHRGLTQTLLVLRARFDGEWKEIEIVRLASNDVHNGMVIAEGRTGVVVRADAVSRLHPGQVLRFAHSGERRLTGTRRISPAHLVLFVDGEIDPERDGAPSRLRLLTPPCIGRECGDAGPE